MSNKFFPLAGGVRLPREVMDRLYDMADSVDPGVLRSRRSQITKGRINRDYAIMGRMCGPKRTLEPGDFFLSGAIVEAYYSPNGTSSEWYPAELVVVKIDRSLRYEVVS